MPGLDRLQRRLTEALDDLYASYVDPREPYYDDDTRWAALGAAGRGDAQAAPLGEAELAALRAECRALALQNEFAVNGHENRVSYIVGRGHAYRAVARKHAAVPERLVADVQLLVDDFLRVNRWARRQQEAALRLDRDGEVFLRYFTAADGMTLVRFVEPGQVATPPDAARDPALSFGIATDPDDVETVRAYYVDGVPVEADAIQHRKANVDANVKRGLPLYYPVRKNLRRAEKLLRNMSTVAEIQSAIALIRKHHGATRTAVQHFAATTGLPPAGGNGPPRTDSVRRYPPGTILDAYGNLEYDFPAAALDASSYVAVLQAELRAIAARLVMPEFMLTADASNGNYASSLVAESPALRTFQRLQARQAADDEEVLRRVLENAVRAGRLDRAATRLVEIQIEAPSPAVRDLRAEAEVRAVEHERGILSAQTWSQLSGYDYDREQAQIAAHKRAFSSVNMQV